MKNRQAKSASSEGSTKITPSAPTDSLLRQARSTSRLIFPAGTLPSRLSIRMKSFPLPLIFQNRMSSMAMPLLFTWAGEARSSQEIGDPLAADQVLVALPLPDDLEAAFTDHDLGRPRA